MGRGRLLVLLFCLGSVTACKARQLNLIERETLKFKAENERIRTEDLVARYEDQRRKSDRLSEDLLVLTRKRDRLYAEYDQAKADLAQVQRDRKAADAAHAQAKADLDKARAERKKLAAELDKERKALATLEKQVAEARKKRKAVEASKQDGKDPAGTG